MSYFAFNRNPNGEVLVSEEDVIEALEMLINQICLLNARFEEVHDTKITIEDVE